MGPQDEPEAVACAEGADGAARRMVGREGPPRPRLVLGDWNRRGEVLSLSWIIVSRGKLSFRLGFVTLIVRMMVIEFEAQMGAEGGFHNGFRGIVNGRDDGNERQEGRPDGSQEA